MGPQHPSTHGVLRLVLELKAKQSLKLVQELDTFTQVLKRTWSTAAGLREQHLLLEWIT
jgi:NADH:ubiquinone oxidoreductase subunit D